MSYQPPKSDIALASATTDTTATATATKDTNSSGVDKLVATNVGATIAESANLPVANNVANLSQSLSIESSLTQTDVDVISKPQIVQPTADSRAIKKYTTVSGDTVELVAKKFGISTQTVKWVNSLTSDALEPGKELTILPTNGILYTVKDGDTIESIAAKYKADKEQLTLFNDLELTSSLAKGRQLIVPDGALPTEEQPGYVAPQTQTVTNNYSYSSVTYGNYGSGTSSGWRGGSSVGNGYAWGNCTFYAYERRLQLGRPIGGMWGNASSWATSARGAGYLVNGTPAAGAVMANGGGYGHVAIVESVNPGVSITISEMNGYRWGGGFNRVGSGQISWAEAVSGRYQYIH